MVKEKQTTRKENRTMMVKKIFSGVLAAAMLTVGEAAWADGPDPHKAVLR